MNLWWRELNLEEERKKVEEEISKNVQLEMEKAQKEIGKDEKKEWNILEWFLQKIWNMLERCFRKINN